jgi:hypothetical protein
MENIGTLHALPLYPTRDPGAEATKKGVLWGIGTGALSYALIKGIESAVAGELHISPRGADIAIAGVLGTLVGGMRGYDTSKMTKISNMQADLLNKYRDAPTIQTEILPAVGIPGSFKYERTAPEKVLDFANMATLFGWVLTPSQTKLHNTMLTGTALTAVGSYATHAVGLNNAEKQVKTNLSYVDKLASERLRTAGQAIT